MELADQNGRFGSVSLRLFAMQFNSLEFLVFLPVVFVLYWLVFNKTVGSRNVFIVVVSCLFYGCWDWRFLVLLFAVTGLCYLAGRRLESCASNEKSKKIWLSAACLISFAALGVFKYFNFFADSLARVMRLAGLSADVQTLQVLLPLGLSFLTLRAVSYVVDVFRGQMGASRDWISFFASLLYFPQLLAGPIERPAKLLPQFERLHPFSQGAAVDGMRQALWGYFKKVVIADNCAIIVNQVYAHDVSMPPQYLLAAAVLFALQIYCDFSGYSDIAIGCSRLFGFELTRNFAFPLFSRNMEEFWQKWNISLNSWFRDYLYVPLGGCGGSRVKTVRNLFLTYGAVGLWHGANWTYVVWGLLNAAGSLPSQLSGQKGGHSKGVAEGRLVPSLKEALLVAGTFFATVITWVFFRSESLPQAWAYIKRMTSPLWQGAGCAAGGAQYPPLVANYCSTPVLFALALAAVGVEWLQREKPHGLYFREGAVPGLLRWAIYYALLALIFLFGAAPQAFIYSRF